MTSKEFIIWMRGFTEGVHDFNITPKQWDILKEKLAEVNDEPRNTIAYYSKDGRPTWYTTTNTTNDKTLLND
jgi:hypothetical protein